MKKKSRSFSPKELSSAHPKRLSLPSANLDRRRSAGSILDWEQIGDAVVFQFHGSIDTHIATDLKRLITVEIQKKSTDFIVFDLAEATDIDSMGIGMFVYFYVHHCDRVKFVFCNLSGDVSQAFGYVKLISFFDIRKTLDDALEDLNYVQG